MSTNTTAYQAAYLRDYREVARAQALCRDCTAPAALRPDGKPALRCELHAAKHRASVSAYGHRLRAERRANKALRESHAWRAEVEWEHERCLACGMTRRKYANGGYVYRELGGVKSTKAPKCAGRKP